jgi:hypothetical protein
MSVDNADVPPAGSFVRDEHRDWVSAVGDDDLLAAADAPK